VEVCIDPLDAFGTIFCPIKCEKCNTTDYVNRNASVSLIGGMYNYNVFISLLFCAILIDNSTHSPLIQM